MAQVKLQFQSINERVHIATRSVQLTVKKTTRSQKTLECQLVVINGSEKTKTSTRQAELDEIIPERLGVSPAILDAVIFCHQDESLWPLSEPAALKKRFDEIFEALKYTKAIDNLKVLRKKQVEQLGKLQNDEAHNKANKDRGERAEARMTALSDEIEEARKQCEELTAQMEKTQELIREKREQSNSFLQIVQSLNNAKERLKYRQETEEELRNSIKELNDDDISLQEQLTQYEETMRMYEEEAQQGKARAKELQNELNEARRDLNSRLAEKGRHESDKDKYERQLQSRVNMVQIAANAHGLRGFDGQLSDQQIRSFREKIQKVLSDHKRDLERLQQANTVELDKATGVITELEGRKAARTQDGISAKQRANAIEKRISILHNESARIVIDEGAKAVLDGQLQELEDKGLRLQQEFKTADWDAQISETNAHNWEQEKENEKLGQELVDCTRLASERAQLDYVKKELADRKRKLETLTSSSKEKLTALLGTTEWDTDSLESQFQNVTRIQSNKTSDIQKRRNATIQKQQKLEFRLKTAHDVNTSKEKELEMCKGKILEALAEVRDNAAVEDYPQEVEFEEGQVDDLRNELSLFDALVDYYNKCKRMLDQKKKCLLCDRGFDDSQGAVVERLSKKIQNHINSKGKIDTENDLKDRVVKLDKLRSVRSVYDTYGRLSAELPMLKQEHASIKEEYDAVERQLEEDEYIVKAEEEKSRDLEDLAKTVTAISQYVKANKESESQIDRTLSQQNSWAASRSVEEIHELQATLAEQMRASKNKLNKLKSDQQRMKDQQHSIDLEKSELRNQISSAASQMEKKKDLQTQIRSLKDDEAQQKEIVQRAKEELDSIEPSIAEARSVRDETLQRGRAREKSIVETRDAVATSINEIRVLDSDIQDYIDRGGPSNLISNQRAIGLLESAISNTEKEAETVSMRFNKLQKDIDNSDQKRRNISDNLKYREHRRELEALRQEIGKLEDRKAHEDYERLQGEARTLENRSNRLLAERGSVMGKATTKDDELSRMLQEWEMDFKDAKRKYRESHIRVETTKAAIEDLAQCGSAVDKAVMQFHAMKMAEVNHIAGELWQSTYQGTDIDTILIRSDHESTTGKRNYNYRLCMVKQDTEMDMRGRCSAGQKVLASIIIRLALAESFGVNCGLIALDEPTTNLDRDNIKSLAESLHRIIQTRRAQKNFQLIVITHDEEFLRHMRCSEFCESFYRVKRDEQQNSIIGKESITQIF